MHPSVQLDSLTLKVLIKVLIFTQQERYFQHFVFGLACIFALCYRHLLSMSPCRATNYVEHLTKPNTVETVL